MNHPHLTDLFNIYQSENQPFRKVHRMIDLFESLIKMHTVVIISEYVKHNRLSDTAKGMLAQGLRTPSLGTWQLFSRILFEELQQDGYPWSFTDFPVAFVALDKALNAAKTNVVSFRNGYAHGATPTDQQCESDIKQFEPFLLQLLESPWLTNTNLEQKDNKVWIRLESNELCLHPILLFKEEADASPYAFFNDLKNDKVGLLNYPLSKHYREKQFYDEFHQYLPLHEWKKTGNNEFYQRIEELTETFKGRTAEREKLLKFVLESNKGYFSIQGNPGIGKSALIAQFFKDLKPHKEIQGLQVVEYFIRRGTAQAQVEYVINYLIRRTDELFPAGREIRAEGKAVWELQQQLFSKWRLWGEQNKGGKLLFLIDGLDEGVENNVVTYLPRENFTGVLVIYGSRPGGHKSIDDLWTQLPVEHHTKMELSGLGKEDIRALIYEVANKYEIDRESAWIDAVQHRSQGNPLYLKLLCDAMENGSIALNDIHALPEKIDEYYKAILDRYAVDTTDGDALLSAMFTFAAAKDYITMSHLALINKLGDATVQRIGSTLKEVLYENPITEDVLDYQLFHESFREYLVKEKAKQVNEAAERIIDFCSDWKELEGTWEQRYALEHFAAHLSESKKEARIEILSKLIYDNSYTAIQKKVLKGFDASNAMYRVALKKSCELKREDDMLEAALCLVDLRYEEANDAPQILAMVANGELDLALKRIESFGGADAEGMKRMFILYMLCLLELTLLESKDKPFFKSGIEMLLNHLDEQIPVDHSLLSWNDFFPSILMFQMSCEWAAMGLDYLRIYKKSDKWESGWILENGPYSDFQFAILLESAGCIIDESDKNSAFSDISISLTKQGKIDEAFACAGLISIDYWKHREQRKISIELAKHGKIDEAIKYARYITNELDKSRVLIDISSELAKQASEEKVISIIHESLECVKNINNDFFKSSALSYISKQLAKQGRINEAIEVARGIISESLKNITLGYIAGKLVEQGKVNEALNFSGGANQYTLNAISIELAKQGKIGEAIDCSSGINDERLKCSTLKEISHELAKQLRIEEALECTKGIENKFLTSSALSNISRELIKHDKIDQALECTQSISSDVIKIRTLSNISDELAQKGKIDKALEFARSITDESDKSHQLSRISTELAKKGEIDDALKYIKDISSDSIKSRAFENVSTELAKQGKIDAALDYAKEINIVEIKIRALSAISSELTKQGMVEKAAFVLRDMLECILDISNGSIMSRALTNISRVLVRKGKIDDALNCAQGINDKTLKRGILIDISSELTKHGNQEKSSLIMQEALKYTHLKSLNSNLICDFSSELAKNGKIDESLEMARGISNNSIRCHALSDISLELAKQNKFILAEKVCLEITLIGSRHDCWKRIANQQKDEIGINDALNTINKFHSQEAQLFYLKGWAESITVDNICPELTNDALLNLVNDTRSLEKYLLVYAQNELFFCNPSNEKINKFKRSLNVQWALDIIAKFPKSKADQRMSTNLFDWIDQITDEDDRQEIELMARKVAKGKITEQEFGDRLKRFCMT